MTWSQPGLSYRRRFWRVESGGVLAPSPSLIIPISNVELAEMEFVYKLADFFGMERVHQSNIGILKKKKKFTAATCINTFPVLCYTNDRG